MERVRNFIIRNHKSIQSWTLSILSLLYTLDKRVHTQNNTSENRSRQSKFGQKGCRALYSELLAANEERTCSKLCSRAGMTSFTVLSTNTPPTIRKHFLSGSTPFRVSRTILQIACVCVCVCVSHVHQCTYIWFQ